MIGTGTASVWDTVILARYDAKENKEYALFIKESVEVPGMGPGESYTGLFGRSVQQDGYWSKDLEYRPGAVFKGTGRCRHTTSLQSM